MSNSIAKDMLNLMQSKKFSSAFKNSNSLSNKLSNIIQDLNEFGEILDEAGLEKSASATLFTLQTLISEASGLDEDDPEEFEGIVEDINFPRSGLVADLPENMETAKTMFVTQKSPFSTLNIFNKPNEHQWLYDVSGDVEPSKQMINLAKAIESKIKTIINDWLTIKYGVHSQKSFESWCKENKCDSSKVFNIDNLAYALYDRFVNSGIKEFTLKEIFGDKLAHSLSQFIDREYSELIDLIKELEKEINTHNDEIEIARTNLMNPYVAQASIKY